MQQIIESTLRGLSNFNDIDSSSQLNFIKSDIILQSPQLLAQLNTNHPPRQITITKDIDKLKHRLSAHYLQRNGHDETDQRKSITEHAITKQLLKQYSHISPTSRKECFSLIRIAAIKIGIHSWRRKFAYSRPDLFGCSYRYPHPSLISARLKELHEYFHQNLQWSPTYAATLTLSRIALLHPLTDGNGRLSRILFNFVICHAFNVNFYLPLHDLSVASEGGFIISIRNAQYYDKWRDISLFIYNSLRLLTNQHS